jgi:hypothetical protein
LVVAETEIHLGPVSTDVYVRLLMGLLILVVAAALLVEVHPMLLLVRIGGSVVGSPPSVPSFVGLSLLLLLLLMVMTSP